MIITMKKDAPEQEIKNLMESIEAKGVKVTMIQGTNYNVFGLVGDTTVIDDRMITANPYVDNVKRIAAPSNTIRLNIETPCGKTGKCITADKEGAELCSGCKSDRRICCNYVVCAQQRHKDRIKVIIIGEKYGY